MNLDDLGRPLSARAAGAWRVTSDALVQEGFWAPSLPADVADAFRHATSKVDLSDMSLSIVRAAKEGGPIVSSVRDLPPGRGSGLWLRRFGADRSIALRCGDVVASVAVTADVDEERIVVGLRRFLARPGTGREGASGKK